jgi:ribosomal protein S18 acetylase RimI-like enzyme
MIRELTPENLEQDMELFVPAYLAIWNHAENLKYLSFTGQRFDEAQVGQWASRHITDGIRYFGATGEDGRIAGLLLTRAIPYGGFELFSLGVLPEEKRRGLGASLVRHGVGLAREDGYPAVEVRVFAGNAPMLCLLLNQGFVPVRMEHHKGPTGEDLVHLKRYVQSAAFE